MDDPAPTDVRVALITTPDAPTAEHLILDLLEHDLAVCGNIVPGITSIYRWQGAIERSAEVLVVVKTTESRVAGLIEQVAATHPYEVPEVIVLPVVAGHEPYMDWVRSGGRE